MTNIAIINGVEVDLDDTGLVYRYQWGPRDYGKCEYFIQVYKMGMDGSNESIYFAGSLNGFEPEIWKELKEKYPTAEEYSTWRMKNA
ncbi:hypothetical protein SEA_WEASELS2_245 [Rhodococcus phage Weasels2]|uniref:Uncharacterized protein n=1 Tax=Rhodococcus phage Weasels2 TaxID=1897437 RepID=A0A1I9SAL7_9CAUD|nr:hypothetical protein FDH04_gp171 [Rhodococcus phage Weasels2]AOZ63823.1 hypothetical protein SEA_WEASELS2_245 [Rhodococcus phage Weasels2]